jgi:hypothetical protein
MGVLETGASNAWNNIKNLAGSLGIMGLGGGLLAVSGLLKSSISDTEQFGEAVLALNQLTGESAESLSGLAGAMQAVGLTGPDATAAIGMLDKMVGKMSTKQELAYETQYGISLRNTTITAQQAAVAEATLADKKATHSEIIKAQSVLNDYLNSSYKTTNELVLQAADYYNNDAIPAETKAAALSKEFGKGWQTLIPLFTQGSDGIQALEQSAADMGLTITTQNLPEIQQMKDANDKWNQSVSALKLQIGLALLPTLSDLMDNVSDFVNNHQTDIVSFFQNAASAAESLGGFITSDVVPALQTIIGWWNSLPGPLRDLIIGGFAVNKITGIGPSAIASIFTSGGSAASVAEGAKGLTPVDPMFVYVVNQVLGGGGFNLTNLGQDAEEAGAAATAATAAGALVSAATIVVGSLVGIAVVDNIVDPILGAVHDAIFGKGSNDLLSQLADYLNTPIGSWSPAKGAVGTSGITGPTGGPPANVGSIMGYGRESAAMVKSNDLATLMGINQLVTLQRAAAATGDVKLADKITKDLAALQLGVVKGFGEQLMAKEKAAAADRALQQIAIDVTVSAQSIGKATTRVTNYKGMVPQ